MVPTMMYGGAPGSYPMMMPVFMPNMGYYGAPGMMVNPFGQSPFAIPQLDGQLKDGKENMNNSYINPSSSWQPKIKQREPVTKEEYLERFNKETFPKLGGKRLVKLQAVGRLDPRTSEAGTPGA